MYRSVEQWSHIRKRVLADGVSKRRMADITGISRNTIRKMLRHPHPQPRRSSHSQSTEMRFTGPRFGYRSSPQLFACRMAYDILQSLPRQRAIQFLRVILGSGAEGGSAECVRRAFVQAAATAAHAAKPNPRRRDAEKAARWVRNLQAGAIGRKELEAMVGGIPDFSAVLDRLSTGTKRERTKAAVVLCAARGYSVNWAAQAIGLSRNTYRGYQRLFSNGGAELLFAAYHRRAPKSDSDAYRNAVFELLHQPPSAYDINRTSWRLDDLCRVLGQKGMPIGRETASQIIRAAGYRWRHAKVVLTSNDPAYREKLDHVQAVLGALQPDEAFFSIDEYGPFAVKMKPGLALTAPGEQHVVPQFQKSRGCMIMTAALELSGNQVTHFYSKKKNTDEMIRMMEVLVESYRDRRRIFLSWDAASWHVSKKLGKTILEHNAQAKTKGGPLVETAPLPAGAQFLNVIESVFSGMSRAIIHNSDYATLGDAKAAIDRYFKERNAAFQANPRRAGRKIWGKEREPPSFSAANNCKDPRYR